MGGAPIGAPPIPIIMDNHPIALDVIAPIPEGWGICLSCEMLMARANLDKAPHERGLEEYPREWMEEFERLSAFILDLAGRYNEKVMIRLWDPRSLQGMFKSLRYGVRRYPTFVVNGKKKITGLSAQAIDEAIQEHIHQQSMGAA